MFSPSLELAAVRDFLRGRCGEISELAPTGAGEWSSAFSFRTPEGHDLIARFGSYREDYEKDRVAMGFAAPPDLPVPEVIEIGPAFDGVYALSRRAFGVGFDTLDEPGYRRVLPGLFRMLDAIAAVEVSGSSGFGIWRSDGTAPFATWREALLAIADDPVGSRLHGWRERLYGVPAAGARFEEGMARLRRAAAGCREVRHLIHGDLMGDNVIVSDDRVVAVVDWANAMYGDFLYDAARLSFWRPWFPALRDVDIEAMARDHYAHLPDFESRFRLCQLHLGLEAQAYNAFTRRYEELERSANHTLHLTQTL